MTPESEKEALSLMRTLSFPSAGSYTTPCTARGAPAFHAFCTGKDMQAFLTPFRVFSSTILQHRQATFQQQPYFNGIPAAAYQGHRMMQTP